MNKITKNILKTISGLIVAAVVILAFLLVGIKLFGIEMYAVLSGSMEPTYHVGSLIYVADTKMDELKVGDAITYKVIDNTLVTHRIIEEQQDENGNKYFITQGDANDTRDEMHIYEKDIVGKPIFTIPFLGYLASSMQSASGRFITIGIGLGLIIIVMFIDMYIEEKTKKEK